MDRETRGGWKGVAVAINPKDEGIDGWRSESDRCSLAQVIFTIENSRGRSDLAALNVRVRQIGLEHR